MTRTAIFDEKFHAPIRWRDIAFSSWLKSTWDDYCKSHEHETKCEKEFEAEYQGLEAMAHWRPPRPSPCLHRRGRRHLLDDNPCSG